MDLSDFELDSIIIRAAMGKIAGLDLNEYKGVKLAIGRLCQLRKVNKRFKNLLTS